MNGKTVDSWNGDINGKFASVFKNKNTGAVIQENEILNKIADIYGEIPDDQKLLILYGRLEPNDLKQNGGKEEGCKITYSFYSELDEIIKSMLLSQKQNDVDNYR